MGLIGESCLMVWDYAYLLIFGTIWCKTWSFLLDLHLSSKPFPPQCSLLLRKLGEKRDGLFDSLRLGSQSQENILEDSLIDHSSQLCIMLCALFQAQEEVDLGSSGRHVRLDEEGLEPDEIGNHV